MQRRSESLTRKTIAVNDSTHPALSLALPATRWAARILSALILLVWGFFLIAHLVGDEGGASRSLNPGDYIGLTTMLAWLVGLAVAWKWELAGGAIALVAVLICALVNWRVLIFPGTLIPITALLFLSSGWMRRTLQRDPVANNPAT